MAKAAVVFIGDELTALGYRLAGAVVSSPKGAAETASAFEKACGEAKLVLVTPCVSRDLPSELSRRALLDDSVLVCVVPDAKNQQEPLDMRRLVRTALGVEG